MWILPNGNILFSHVKGAKEVTRGKDVVWQYETADENEVHACQPLPEGTVMVAESGPMRIIEVDREGRIAKEVKVVWEINENDLPGNPLRFVAGMQRLPNGNTLVCNWGGHGHVGEQPQVFEVTRDKRVVGEIFDFSQFGTITGVFLLGVEGDATRFEILR